MHARKRRRDRDSYYDERHAYSSSSSSYAKPYPEHQSRQSSSSSQQQQQQQQLAQSGGDYPSEGRYSPARSPDRHSYAHAHGYAYEQSYSPVRPYDRGFSHGHHGRSRYNRSPDAASLCDVERDVDYKTSRDKYSDRTSLEKNDDGERARGAQDRGDRCPDSRKRSSASKSTKRWNPSGTNGDWSEHISSSGKKYYYNCLSEVSQWEKPREWHEKRSKYSSRAEDNTESSHDRREHREQREPERCEKSERSHSHRREASGSASHSNNWRSGVGGGSSSSTITTTTTTTITTTTITSSSSSSSSSNNNNIINNNPNNNINNSNNINNNSNNINNNSNNNNNNSNNKHEHQEPPRARTVKVVPEVSSAESPPITNLPDICKNLPPETNVPRNDYQDPRTFPANVTTLPRIISYPATNGTSTTPPLQMIENHQQFTGPPTPTHSENPIDAAPAADAPTTIPRRYEYGSYSTLCSTPGPALTSSLSNYMRKDLIDHVKDWPADVLEFQAQKYSEEANVIAKQVTRVSSELKVARSIVRENEIRATLQEQKIMYLRQQIKDLEKSMSQNSIMCDDLCQ